MILRSVFLGACIALAQSAAAEVPGDANQFTLICRWDAGGEDKTLQIYGPGRHLFIGQLGEEVIENHTGDSIVQRTWVLKAGT